MLPNQILVHLRGVRFPYSRYSIAFELTHALVRTFKGCNVAWFTVLEKIFMAQNYLVPPHSP